MTVEICSAKGYIVKRVSVTSSNLESVGYDETTQILEVAFKHGGIYRYFDVPIEVYSALIVAASVGSFFAQNIKNQYRYERVQQ